jgi:spermidine/putrescine transport system substrate-binding protein
MRYLHRLLLAATLLALAAGCTRTPGGTVTVYMWSEYIDPELVGRFQKETGARLVLDTYENTETMMSKVASASNQYDVVVMSDHAVRTLIAQGIVGPLDSAKVPNARNVAPRFRNPGYDPEGTHSLPYQWGTMGLVYRTDKIPDFEPSWGVLFDPSRQPGPIVLLDSMRDLIGAALFYGGASPNTRSEDDLELAGRTLLAARTPRLLGFYGSPDSVGKVLSGDAWVGMAYNGDAVARLDENTEFVVPVEGTIIWVDAMTVPTQAPNREGAHRFLDFILTPDVGAALSNYLAYATPNEASLPQIDEEIRADPRVYPPQMQIERMQLLEDIGAATQLYDQIWTRLKAGP